MIKIEDLNLVLQKNVILDNINLELHEGKIYGLIGRNGSGKSMLMKCMCGFIVPNSGTVTFNGKRIGKDIDFPESAGIIIETPGFIMNYSGYKNLKFLSDLKKKLGREKIKDTLRQVGLDPEMKRPVKKYSLGMRQRLGLAQAIMEEPDVLILDEPMNGLDKEGVRDMRKYLLDYKREDRIILLSSHSSEDIEVLCDEVIEMEHGKITSVK